MRSRALAIYQLSSNGGLVVGTFLWGWLGTRIGLPATLLAAGGSAVVSGVLLRRFGIDGRRGAAAAPAEPDVPAPEAVAPELRPVLEAARGRVLKSQHYRIDPAEQEAFLSVMAEVRDVRGRAGALVWQLYEDVAHADCWLEVWSVENWTGHLLRIGAHPGGRPPRAGPRARLPPGRPGGARPATSRSPRTGCAASPRNAA